MSTQTAEAVLAALPEDERLKPCTGTCGRITRTSGMSIARYPGTVTRVGEGKCASCKRATTLPPGTPPGPGSIQARNDPRGQRWTEEGVERAKAADETYRRQRAERLARQQRAEAARIQHLLRTSRGNLNGVRA